MSGDQLEIAIDTAVEIRCIRFAEWMLVNGFKTNCVIGGGCWWGTNEEGIRYTTEEMYEMFTEIVNYE
jgi:hypothetical protein